MTAPTVQSRVSRPCFMQPTRREPKIVIVRIIGLSRRHALAPRHVWAEREARSTPGHATAFLSVPDPQWKTWRYGAAERRGAFRTTGAALALPRAGAAASF